MTNELVIAKGHAIYLGNVKPLFCVAQVDKSMHILFLSKSNSASIPTSVCMAYKPKKWMIDFLFTLSKKFHF